MWYHTLVFDHRAEAFADVLDWMTRPLTSFEVIISQVQSMVSAWKRGGHEPTSRSKDKGVCYAGALNHQQITCFPQRRAYAGAPGIGTLG